MSQDDWAEKAPNEDDFVMDGEGVMTQAFAVKRAAAEIVLRLLMRDYHLIEGNLTMKADVMLARFYAIGGEHIMVERSPERAAVLLKFRRQKQEFEFTWEEAKLKPYVYCKDGKTLKDNWSTPRRRMQMLWARLVSDSVRAFAPQTDVRELAEMPAPAAATIRTGSCN